MMPMEDEEDELSAISSVMAADAPEAPAAEPKASGDPETLVSELKQKLAELEASLSQL